VFFNSVSRAWNHAGSVFFAAAAFLLLLHAVRRDRLVLLAVSGTLLGLAIGVRLTVLPVVGGFGCTLLLLGEDRSRPRVIARCAAFGAGVLLGLLPVVLLAAPAFDRFYMGNFVYPKISNLYHAEAGQVWTW